VLERAGARFAVPELMESSLQLGRALLRSLGRHGEEVDRVVERLRARYHAAPETFVPAGGIAPNEAERDLGSTGARAVEPPTADRSEKECGILQRLARHAARMKKFPSQRGSRIF
jgi:hypothetical protein